MTGGRWYSYYDNAHWTAPSDLDIDHLVPLAEAWDSGARNWTASQRQAYTNDLGDSRYLVAVTDNVNQAKGGQDPAQWMPSYSGATCRYVKEWLVVKLCWRLTADTAEKNALTRIAAGCANVTITRALCFQRRRAGTTQLRPQLVPIFAYPGPDSRHVWMFQARRLLQP